MSRAAARAEPRPTPLPRPIAFAELVHDCLEILEERGLVHGTGRPVPGKHRFCRLRR